MSQFLLSLDEVRLADRPRVGGKAAALGELKRAGLPVPAGLCLSGDAFQAAMAGFLPQIDAWLAEIELTPLTAVTLAEQIAALLADLRLPSQLRAELELALPALAPAGTPLVVRSSAAAEDSAQASYAGQYRSLVGVRGLEALSQAILAVWCSYYSANALVARATHGGLEQSETMGVLIMPLVAAECSGVAMSLDPVQPQPPRVVVSAVWGLGVGVVDGSVPADSGWVRRGGSAETFEIEQRRVVEKPHQFGLDGDGRLGKQPVPQAQRRAACLPDAWLVRVAQFCAAAEGLFGAPQDIEWAIAGGRFWLLQSRPLTTLPPELARCPPFPVAWPQESDRQHLWQLYPYWRHVLRPLEWDYAADREAASEFGAQWAGGERIERFMLVNGRAYECWMPSRQPPADRWVRQQAMADLLARLHRQDQLMWDYWGPEIIKATQRLDAFDRQKADGPGLADHLEAARAVNVRHWGLHGYIWRAPLRPLYQAYAAVSGLAEAEVKAQVDQLLEGMETPLTRLIDQLYQMAQTARETPSVAELLRAAPEDLLGRLRQMPAAAAFLAQLEAFLQTYGQRSGLGYGSDGTLMTPTWGDRPELVLRLLVPYLEAGATNPAEARQAAQRRRDALLESACRECPDPAAVDLLRRRLAHARRAMAVGEEHNHYIDQLSTGQLRRAILAAAGWLAQAGVLAQVDDIFWLRYREILDALHGQPPADLPGLIAARQRQHQQWQQLTAPPLLGRPPADLPQRPPLADDLTPAAAHLDGRLQGQPASPGQAAGPARLARSDELLPQVSPGDILVAENMGPRWTPLLPLLGGLVLDGGSPLQHAAITAREYGVPAVTETGNATRLIAEGEWIEVDGTTGLVSLARPGGSAILGTTPPDV